MFLPFISENLISTKDIDYGKVVVVKSRSPSYSFHENGIENNEEKGVTIVSVRRRKSNTSLIEDEEKMLSPRTIQRGLNKLLKH